MAHATIAANFNQALNIQLLFTAQVAFHGEVLGDLFAQSSHISFRQILNADVGVDFGFCQNFVRAGKTDTKQVGQPNLDTFVTREVNTFNTCHVLLPLPLFMLGVFADHKESAAALDNFALRATFSDRG
jgi:hypothetical protein